jgi:CubicO group peptidase (beta-lactamase class C family)
MSPVPVDGHFVGRRHGPGGLMPDLQALLDEAIGSGVPGAVALVDRAGEVELAVAGVARADGTPMSADTVFRIASVTKPIVGALGMTLLEDRTVELADRVDRWVPEWADPRVLRSPDSPLADAVPLTRRVTVEDLLTFRSGIGFPADFSYPVVEQVLDLVQQVPGQSHPVSGVDEWLRRLAAIPLLHQPGDGWTYNVSADVLGVLLARAADLDLPTLAADRLFAPLGMTDTGFAVPPESAGRLADQFDNTGGAVLEAATASDFRVPPPFPSGAGGLVSTAADLHRFGRMLLGRAGPDDARVLSANSRRAMMVDRLTEQHRASGALFLEGDGWGYCGSVGRGGPEPWQRAGRFGWVGGTGTALHVLPDADTVTILLTQQMMSGPSTTDLMHRFWTYAGRS